jgi:hypothetical protein
MNLLTQLNKSIDSKPKEVKSNRPVMPIPTDVVETFIRFAGAKSVFDVAEARKDAEANVLNESLFNAWTDDLFKQGNQPPNPDLKTAKDDGHTDISAKFQVQKRFKLNILPGDGNINERLALSLGFSGVSKAVAQKLITEEIDLTPQTVIRPFNELLYGHYENKVFVESSEKEKAIALKLLKFAMENLTEEERNIAIKKEESVKVKEGFFQRVTGYIKNIGQLRGIFKIIVPVYYTSHIKFGVSDTPDERINRLTEECRKMLGREE